MAHSNVETHPSPIPNKKPTLGYVSRFFLRSLAKRRRDPQNAAEWVPYVRALLDTTFFFVAMPTAAMFSIVSIVGIKYFPHLVTHTVGLAPRSFTVATLIASLGGGYAWFRYRFRAYPYNARLCSSFDSERDRSIVVGQMVGGFVICFLMILASGIIFLVLLG
jgi:hypothetical protein